jgi:hypothetical protein
MEAIGFGSAWAKAVILPFGRKADKSRRPQKQSNFKN